MQEHGVAPAKPTGDWMSLAGLGGIRPSKGELSMLVDGRKEAGG